MAKERQKLENRKEKTEIQKLKEKTTLANIRPFDQTSLMINYSYI